MSVCRVVKSEVIVNNAVLIMHEYMKYIAMMIIISTDTYSDKSRETEEMFRKVSIYLCIYSTCRKFTSLHWEACIKYI